MTPQDILVHLDAATPWPHATGFEVPAAYRCAQEVRELRLRRGEVPRGIKIGFTNRSLWPKFGLDRPVWSTVWDTTLSFCDGEGSLALAGLCEPRIEPEVVFGLRDAPRAGMSLDELLACVAWIAPGFEIVQSHTGWSFTAADAVADGGLHGRLQVGRRHAVAEFGVSGDEVARRLAECAVQLTKENAVMDEGRGANVLGGPLEALRELVNGLAGDPSRPPLQGGDVVTTGTITQLFAVAPGEAWTATHDAPLGRLLVRFR
jgi:2-keto-4-pentenoate hydratase